MSKRNFILLIIVLAIIAIAIFGFLYFRKGTTTPGGEGTGTNFFSQFNPFGTKPKPPVTPPPVDISGYVPPPATEAPVKLVKVSSMPIAGFTVFVKERPLPVLPLIKGEEKGGGQQGLPLLETTAKLGTGKTEFAPALRYVARATGHIYQTFADKIMEKQFSGTTIPKVYDAYFGNRGGSVVMRYLKTDKRTIETFVGALPKELLGADPVSNNEIKGYFLPNNVKDISLSPDTLKMFYLFESGNNSENNIVGVVLNFLNDKKIQIFDSPFTEWLSWWPSANTITLSTKPTANIPGYMYTIDSAGKNLSKVLGDINGLTTLEAPNGKLILYGNSNLSLSIYHTDTRNSDTLGIKTMPEKCVWVGNDTIYCAAPKTIGFGEYPDSWYQGETSFNDQLWKIDVKTGNSALLVNPITIKGGEEIDGIKIITDESENYLFFVNKKDSFLWKFERK